MRITTIGSCMIDAFLECPCPSQLILRSNGAPLSFRLFQEGSKIELSDLKHYFGGGACNTSISFARFGFKTSIIAAISPDAAGKQIIDHLEKGTVETHILACKSDDKTGASFIIPCSNADRLALVYRGANNMLTPDEVIKRLAPADAIYLCSLHKNLAKETAKITRLAKKYAPYVICNPGTSQLKVHAQAFATALDTIDILILNAHEAGILSQALDLHIHDLNSMTEQSAQPSLLQTPLPSARCRTFLRTFMSSLHEIGPQLIVVTNGAEGVYVSDGSQILFQASHTDKVVSTLGAGDAFGSCFTAQFLRKKSLTQCIQSGIINSLHVLTFLDTQTGLLDTQTLEGKLQSHNLPAIEVHKL